MERWLCYAIVVFLLIGSVMADDWDNFSSDEAGTVGEDVANAETENTETDTQNDGGNSLNDDSGSEEGEKKFTNDFYIAIILAIIGLCILIILLYLFFRKPQNQWEKKKQTAEFE